MRRAYIGRPGQHNNGSSKNKASAGMQASNLGLRHFGLVPTSAFELLDGAAPVPTEDQGQEYDGEEIVDLEAAWKALAKSGIIKAAYSEKPTLPLQED